MITLVSILTLTWIFLGALGLLYLEADVRVDSLQDRLVIRAVFLFIYVFVLYGISELLQ